jgi:hypothetical protein
MVCPARKTVMRLNPSILSENTRGRTNRKQTDPLTGSLLCTGARGLKLAKRPNAWSHTNNKPIITNLARETLRVVTSEMDSEVSLYEKSLWWGNELPPKAWGYTHRVHSRAPLGKQRPQHHPVRISLWRSIQLLLRLGGYCRVPILGYP